MRYIGCLADILFDAYNGDIPLEQGYGCRFDDLTVSALMSVMGRAIGPWFSYPDYFHR